MQLQRRSNKQKINIEESYLLGSGGEAKIYLLRHDQSLVAKIYHNPTDERSRKLTIMIDNPPDNPILENGQRLIAWPLDLLLNNQGQIVGFLMQRLVNMKSIFNFYNPSMRRKEFPLFNYLYLHRIARNLATAVHALHKRGYVIGDLNESNIFVSNTALVTMIDTDSFQVPDSNRGIVYRCPVGKPEFTPPELQGKSFADIDRSVEHDRFGLAILIFQLLMEGVHPFFGVFLGEGDPPQYEDRISAGHFPYSIRKSVPYKPAKIAPPFDILHPELRRLFIRCFEDGHNDIKARPDPKEWQYALNEGEKSLITCDTNSQHLYGNHLSACPWCGRTSLLEGHDPFPSVDAVKSGQHLQPVTIKKSPPQRPTVTITPPSQQITGKDGALMVPIPAGDFQMGSNDYDNEKPIHTVYLDAFYIDIYEVTNAQYKKFMDATGHKAPYCWNDSKFNAPNHPVVGVSWDNAVAYAKWAGKRLPTEAEWEKSARGGLVGKKYPWGDILTHDDANYSGKGGKDKWEQTSPVRSFAPNGYGLYDMAGNVWEWCEDWYSNNYYANSPKSNPKGPGSGKWRVLRGGSWYDSDDDDLRVADGCGDAVGFRCVQ
jgi:formylglycine-generating enzyme required for sulfatase activity